MCPTADEVETTTNGINGHTNGTNGAHPGYTGINVSSAPRNPRNPYMAPTDFISNIGRFKIIESTLREGEQ
jgi:homocitrate synthase